MARVGDKKMHTGFGWGHLCETEHLEDPDLDSRVTLKWILKKRDVKVWTGLI